jgi:Ser/Thr protein kinase RdoA (MazF antagonist)
VDRKADRGVVLLEYLPDMRQGDVLAGCTREEALTLAAILVRLHAHWWGGDHPALNALNAVDDSDANGPPIREGRLQQFLDRHGPSLSAELLELIDGLPDRLDTANQYLQAGPRTLIHRDFHLDNLLFTPSGEPFVIDWQGAATGPPATDLAQFLVECMTREQRRQFGTSALEAYLHQLETSGVRPGVAITNQILAALDLLLAGTINWLGKTPPDPPNTRKGLLGKNLLRNIADTISSLSG